MNFSSKISAITLFLVALSQVTHATPYIAATLTATSGTAELGIPTSSYNCVYSPLYGWLNSKGGNPVNNRGSLLSSNNSTSPEGYIQFIDAVGSNCTSDESNWFICPLSYNGNIIAFVQFIFGVDQESHEVLVQCVDANNNPTQCPQGVTIQYDADQLKLFPLYDTANVTLTVDSSAPYALTTKKENDNAMHKIYRKV